MKRSIINEFGESVIVIDSSDRGPLTDEEIKMMENLEAFTDEYDEDCLPMPEAMVSQIKSDIANKKKADLANAKIVRAMA